MGALCLAVALPVVLPRLADLRHTDTLVAVAFGTVAGLSLGGAAMYRRTYLYRGEMAFRIVVGWTLVAIVITLLANSSPVASLFSGRVMDYVTIARALFLPIGARLLAVAMFRPLPAYTPWGMPIEDEEPDHVPAFDARLNVEREPMPRVGEATAAVHPEPLVNPAAGPPAVSPLPGAPQPAIRRRGTSGPARLEVVKGDEDDPDDIGSARRNRAGS